MNNPKCKNYKPRDEKAKVNCPNCYRWIGTRCEGHETLIKDNAEIKKDEAIDHMMRDNKGVKIDA